VSSGNYTSVSEPIVERNELYKFRLYLPEALACCHLQVKCLVSRGVGGGQGKNGLVGGFGGGRI
jgi:hypothetical protein